MPTIELAEKTAQCDLMFQTPENFIQQSIGAGITNGTLAVAN